MEVLSLIGGIQATGSVVAVIVQILKNLSDARGRFLNADTTIRLLISELTVIKASVLQIEDWAKYNLAETPTQHGLAEAFKVCFEGCQLAMGILAQEVDGLVSRNPFLMKAKVAWNETGMKEHADRLRDQVAALHLLIQAVHCHNEMQQAALLEQPSSRRIIQKVADDTSTLRASRAYTQLGSGPPSIISHEDSTIGSATYGVDRELVNTGPYRKARAHQESKRQKSPNRNPFLSRSMPEEAFKTESNEINPRVSVHLAHENTIDSGFYDEDADIVNPTAYRAAMANAPVPIKNTIQRSISAPLSRNSHSTIKPDEEVNQLTPIERFKADWQQPQRIDFDPFETHSPIHPSHHQPSRPDSLLSHTLSGGKTAELRKSPWGTLKRLTSRAVLPKSGSSTSPSPGGPGYMHLNPKSVKRKSETNIHQSIDFGSEDGLSAPAIVRAAQSASAVEIERLLEHRVDIEAKHEKSGRTALAVASHCGNDSIVTLLLHHRAYVEVKDVTGMTPLHLAASRGHYRVVQCLLQDHANVDTKGPNNKTPLRFACDNGHFNCCELLLQYRAKVNARDEHMVTALHAAAKIGDVEIIELLLKNGADIEAKDGNLMTAIHYAAEGDYDAVVQALVSHKADIESRGFQGKTPLASACASGSYQTASLLISKKANVKHRADGGMTPLHLACLNDRADTADLLLQQKRLNIDTKDDEGRTALHLAVKSRAFSAADLLLRRGANVESLCNRTLRPIHYASDNADHSMVQLLVGSSAQIEASTQLGWRPIHLAAVRGSEEIIDILLRRGVQIDAFNHSGERALTLACEHGHLGAVRMLLDRGSPMRLRSPQFSSLEDSPLCRAARSGHVAVCQELIARGASLAQHDEKSWQPLRYAAYYGHVEVVEVLLAVGARVGRSDVGNSTESLQSATSFGFANDVNAERRRAIGNLLMEAAQRERKRPTRLSEDDPFLTVSYSGEELAREPIKLYEVES